MKHTEEITLADLMAEEIDVYVRESKGFGYDLQLEYGEGEVFLDEQGIHPCAMDSFADVCRRFLQYYDRAKERYEERL